MNPDFLKGYIHGLRIAENLDTDGIVELLAKAEKELATNNN